MLILAAGPDFAPGVTAGGIIGVIVIAVAAVRFGWGLFTHARSWQIELDGDGVPEDEGGHLPLRAWRRRIDDRTGQHTGQLEAIQDELRLHRVGIEYIKQLADELVPNHGSSFRDEYREDQEAQRAAMAAIAEHVGVALPEPARREPRARSRQP